MTRLGPVLLLAIACGPTPSTPTTTPERAPAVDAPATPAPAAEPEPAPPPVAEISFTIDDSFDISGRGPVAMGRLRGHLEVGDKLVIEGSDPPIVVEVLAVELQRGSTATPDTSVGLLLRLPSGSNRSVLVRGATMSHAK